MQLLAPAHGSRAGSSAASAPPSWWRRPAIPVALRSRHSGGARRSSGGAVPARPHLRRAAAHDDHRAERRNVHALAIEGTFDDCQALVKGMFNHHAFRDRVRLSGVNSINWARIIAQAVYYFTAAVALGAPHRKIAFTVPTGNFGDVYAGYVAQRMGLPVDRLVIATNVNDILARTLATGTYEIARRGADHARRRWTSRCRRISSVCCSMPTAATRAAVRTLMGSLAQSRRFALSARALSEIRARVHRRPRRRRGDRRRPSAPGCARPDYLRRSAYGGRRRGRREGNPRSVGADGGARHRASGEISRCSGGRLRRAAAAARLARRSAMSGRSASRRCRPIRRRSSGLCRRPQPRRA